MAGEDLLEDEGTGTEEKSGKRKHKPLSKGQKIGVGIGLITILLIIYQVRKQSAANASATGSSIDPVTGYPSGSSQDQAALQAMQGSSSGSFPSGSPGTGGVSGGSGSSGFDLGSYLSTLPSTNPLSPYYVPSDTGSAPALSPTINVTVPPSTVITQPGSTVAAQGGASTTHDGSPPANTLLSLINSISPNHTTVVVGGHTYYGIGNNPALTSIATAAHQQGISYTQTNAKALGLPGGKAAAQYIG